MTDFEWFSRFEVWTISVWGFILFVYAVFIGLQFIYRNSSQLLGIFAIFIGGWLFHIATISGQPNWIRVLVFFICFLLPTLVSAGFDIAQLARRSPR